MDGVAGRPAGPAFGVLGNAYDKKRAPVFLGAEFFPAKTGAKLIFRTMYGSAAVMNANSDALSSALMPPRRYLPPLAPSPMPAIPAAA